MRERKGSTAAALLSLLPPHPYSLALLSSLLPPLFVLRQQQPSPEAAAGKQRAMLREGGQPEDEAGARTDGRPRSEAATHATASRPFQRPAGALLFWGLIPLARLVDAFSDQYEIFTLASIAL